MSDLNFTRDQLLDLKHLSRELADHASIAFFANDTHDKTWHDKEALNYLLKLVELSKGVEL